MNDKPLDPNDLLMGGGTPWAKFEVAGDTVTGTITEVSSRQARDFDTNALVTWDDGSPKFEVAITLATDLRDPEIEDDSGMRLLVLNSMGKKDAVKAAVKKVGAKGLAVGDYLSVTMTGQSPVPGKKFRQKDYTAEYAIGLGATRVDDEPTDEPPF